MHKSNRWLVSVWNATLGWNGLIVIMNLNWKTLFKLFWNYSEKKELYETSSLELFVEIN